jgi:hypothetical protein
MRRWMFRQKSYNWKLTGKVKKDKRLEISRFARNLNLPFKGREKI